VGVAQQRTGLSGKLLTIGAIALWRRNPDPDIARSTRFQDRRKRGIGHAEFWIRQCVAIEHDTNGMVEQLWYRCGGRAG
jgi:hypothetical protein